MSLETNVPQTFEEWWALNGGATGKDDIPPSDWDHDNAEAAFAAGVASQQTETEKIRKACGEQIDYGMRLVENQLAEAKAEIVRMTLIIAHYEAVVVAAGALVDGWADPNLDGYDPRWVIELRAALAALDGA